MLHDDRQQSTVVTVSRTATSDGVRIDWQQRGALYDFQNEKLYLYVLNVKIMLCRIAAGAVVLPPANKIVDSPIDFVAITKSY